MSDLPVSTENSAEAPTAVDTASWKLMAALTVAGLVSGLALAGVYEATLPMIKANEAAALQRAVLAVVPGSTQFQALVARGAEVEVVARDTEGPLIYAAYDGAGAFKGYAVPSQGGGFQDKIKLIYGFDRQSNQIVGMEVLESKETPGLGDKIYKDMDFVGAFKGLALDGDGHIEGVKKGDRSKPHQVDCITGATISSKAVVKIVNMGNDAWLSRLPPAGHEPAMAAAGTAAPKGE